MRPQAHGVSHLRFVTNQVGAWAERRGRSFAGFMFLSIFTSPILAAIVLVIKSDATVEKENLAARSLEEDRKEALRVEERRRINAEHLESIKALQASSGHRKDTEAESAVDKLAKLSSLLEKGLVSDQEFKDLKAAIIKGES